MGHNFMWVELSGNNTAAGYAGAGTYRLFNSAIADYGNSTNSDSCGNLIRPVVILNSRVQLTRGADVNGVAGWNIQ